MQLFSAVETPSCCLASRERIYKTSDVAGPASAISSLSHKLKGGYACKHGEVIQILHSKCYVFSSFHSFSFHSLNRICSSWVSVGSLFDMAIQCVALLSSIDFRLYILAIKFCKWLTVNYLLSNANIEGKCNIEEGEKSNFFSFVYR